METKHSWPILPPSCLYDFGLAYRVHLGHDVKLAQPAPAHFFTGRGVKLVFVRAVYRAHIREPILQRQSRPVTQGGKHAAAAVMAANDDVLYF